MMQQLNSGMRVFVSVQASRCPALSGSASMTSPATWRVPCSVQTWCTRL